MFYDNSYKLFSTERKETICVKSDCLTCIVIRKLFDIHWYIINSATLSWIDLTPDKAKLRAESKVQTPSV